MAKGDSNASQTSINTQGGQAQNVLNNAQSKASNQYDYSQGLAQNANTQAQNNYSGIMGSYGNFAGSNPYGSSTGSMNTQMAPSGMNAPQSTGDPATDAVNQAFARKGVQPNPGEVQYWVDNINKTGGMTGDNAGYWTNRMAQGSGGVGDRGGSSGGGAPAGADVFGALNPAISGLNNFAQTGGLSPQDIADIRARNTSAVRGVYQNAQSDLSRGRALSGGYMPNEGAAQSQLARNMGQAVSDANVNTNASLAQLLSQNRLAGLSGLSNIGGMGLQSQISNRGLDLSALGGMTGLYGTTPGLANMYGNQAQNALGANLQGAQLQNQLGLGIMGAQNQKANIPGNYQSALGNISGTLGLAGDVAGMANGLGISNPFAGSVAGKSPIAYNGMPNMGAQMPGPF